ncbi:hypothetical protein ACHAPU_003797 [Fusarium lateritium]
MAPLHLNLESLTLQNCRAFVGGRDAEFDVLTRIDASGQWYALVLKTEDGKRTKILENNASRPDRALELLHEASARVVDQYVTCHGYDLPPSTTARTSTSMRGGLVKPGVIACGSSDSEAFASDSDDSVLPPRRSHRRGHHSSRGASDAASTRLEREEALSASDSDEPARRRTPWGMGLHQRPAGMHIHNPPQAWGHPMQAPAPAPVPVMAPASLPAPIPGARQAPSLVPPPPGARNIPIPRPGLGKTYSARLSINWPGNGKRNMLVNVMPTLHCLQALAINEASLRPMTFANPPGLPYHPLPGRGNNGSSNLRATVRRVTLGEDDTYEMAAFGNDLTALFRSTSSIPKFDIEVTAASMVSVSFPPMPPPRPVSAASSSSSGDIAD